MSRRSTADGLAAALEEALVLCLGALDISDHRWTDWHSATFNGARHELTLLVDHGARAKLDAIANADLPLRRGFVADISVTTCDVDGASMTVTLEALTVAA